ncbi:MAG: molybdenum cofactor guanylyltransferase [Nitrospinae bacterium]|nr:molybdenum cofactor guanylyltransferase [Nitrospinota bacterium]
MAHRNIEKGSSMTGVILAGGRNSRIGLKKALLEIGGKRIIDRTAEIYKKIFDEILIITKTPEDYKYLGLKVYADLIPQTSSLIGIYTGLYYSSSDYSFFASCDMPFLEERVIRHQLSKLQDKPSISSHDTSLKGEENYDIIIPYFKHRLHPLHAIYSKRCLENIKEMIEEDRMRLKDLLSRKKVKRVMDIPETRLNPFFNINTMKDYLRADKMYLSPLV